MVLVASAGLFFAAAGDAQDPMKVAPSMNKVLVNNDRVRVLDVVLKPGEKLPMHSHPDNVLYVIAGGTLKFTDSKGRMATRTMKAGDCRFRPGETHTVENTGQTVVHSLDIELKH